MCMCVRVHVVVVVVVVVWLNQSYQRLLIQDSRVLEVLSPPLRAIGASFFKTRIVVVVENLKELKNGYRLEKGIRLIKRSQVYL